MSNRIAAARTTDGVALVAWPPRPARWQRLTAVARTWLQPQAAAGTAPGLSPWLRRDLGLAAAAEAGSAMLDVEARRLGF